MKRTACRLPAARLRRHHSRSGRAADTVEAVVFERAARPRAPESDSRSGRSRCCAGRRRDGIRPPGRRPRHGSVGDRGAVASAFGPDVELRRACTLLGDNVDDADHRVRTIERALRAFQHFDPLDGAWRKHREIEIAARGCRVVDPDPVDHHQCLARIGAAQPDVRGRTRSTAFGDVEAGNGSQGVDQRAGIAGRQRLAFDHAD